MTLRIPDALAPLRAIAADFRHAPVFVIREPAPGEEWDDELPVLRVEHCPGSEYLEVRTAVPAAGRTPRGALAFGEVVEKLEAFGPESRELFWVSSLRPLPDTDPEVAGYAVCLALPLRSVLTGNAPPRVAFLARTDGLPAARTA